MAAMMSCEDPQIAIGHHITSPYLIELSFAFKNTSKTLSKFINVDKHIQMKASPIYTRAMKGVHHW